MDVHLVWFFVCVYICVCVCQCLQIQGLLCECHSIWSGASGLFRAYYCAPLVCVPAAIGLLAVWRHNNPNPKPVISTGRCRRIHAHTMQLRLVLLVLQLALQARTDIIAYNCTPHRGVCGNKGHIKIQVNIYTHIMWNMQPQAQTRTSA